MDEFRRLRAESGVRAALVFLNALGPYRFTAMYRRDGDTMRNIHFVDRDHPEILQSDDIALAATYCQYAMATGKPFSTRDALSDLRLRDHVARNQVRSYCGVPLLDSEGRALGTLCSFDYVPVAQDGIDLELMLELPPLLRPFEKS